MKMVCLDMAPGIRPFVANSFQNNLIYDALAQSAAAVVDINAVAAKILRARCEWKVG